MPSTTDAAKQAIIATLKLFEDEASGSESSSFQWPFSKTSYTDSYIDDDVYEELRASIRVAEAADELLRWMSASAGVAVANLKGKFNDITNQRRFQALPDEVIALVLEMAYKSHTSYRGQIKTVKRLSLVSRRFRNIVIGSPIFWSNIQSSILPVNRAKLFASRVVTPIMTLTINGVADWKPEESERERILNMYQLAVSISSRIRKLQIALSSTDVPYLQQIRQICSDISLPSVFELTLACSSDVSRRCQDFCSGWDMPSLRILNFSGVLPQLPSGVLSRINNCSVKVNYANDIWNTSEIMAFLLSLTTVKDLRIAVRLFGVSEEPDQVAQMDSVESLTLELKNSTVAKDPNILHLIGFPSITSFKLDLGLRDIDDLTAALENIEFQVPPSATHVALSVGVEYESHFEPMYIVGNWCYLFGGLKNLVLESKREKGHGFLSFASSIDAINVINLEGKELDGDRLEQVTRMWGRRHPHRTAVISVDDVSRKGTGKIEYSEREDGNSDREHLFDD
ncbi:hypothetical protein SCHPADRAFT_943031 [Schizopora paradoxa]|uniref:F-box domain-containing protein n=1 Tax=Schizopora paradoxa TaxID=27342 RepID=A0A0H2RL90_9AGAM|nr:hypothetical protein SCHPADRAFT_943031 [Schizopora paradoxa]